MPDQEGSVPAIEASAEEIAEAVIRLKAEQALDRRIGAMEQRIEALQRLVLELTLGSAGRDPAQRKDAMARLAADPVVPATLRWRVHQPEGAGTAAEAAPCATAHPGCASACCRLVEVPLTPAEAMVHDWDPARPFVLRRREDGACIHLDAAGACAIYADRPAFCRSYSCTHDRRVWEWIDQHRP